MNNKLILIIVLFFLNIPIIFSIRIDNLNVIEVSRIIEIDTGLPQFFNLNLSRNGLLKNNSFISANILNFTFNASDKNNGSIISYYNVKNATNGYVSNITKNLTIRIGEDGNYTFAFAFNDSAGNTINGSTYQFALDTKAPTFISAFNRTADSNNNTAIKTNTPVNITIFGLDDLYLKDGNFSHNASGSWTNHSITIIGNNTPYHYVIGNGNFSANQVVGWKFYVNDLAGNQLDPIYTFVIEGIPPLPYSQSGGGGGGSISVPLGFTQAVLFGEEPTNNTCKQGFQMLDERCYECNPERGYLQFNDQDRSVACILCSEGFRLENKKCILRDVEFKPNIYYKYVDDTAIKISNFFKTDNPTIGYIVIMSGLAILGSNILTWLMKKPNVKK